MADRKHRAQSPGQRAVELIGDHRMNDLVFGHPGRITYTPLEIDVDGADVGDLSSNRSIAEEDTVLQQVTKTAEWFPSTGVASETRSFLKRERRPHRSWLLKGQPQAFMGTLGVDSSIADELKHPSTPDDQERPLSLLTVGEITDATDPSRSTGHPALAMAVGQSGHILRVVKLQAENWQWEKGESVSLGLVSGQETEEGHLCGDSVPYHQLKFVSSRKRYSPTRWLLAQKSTRTTIFAPELGRLPISCSSDACSLAATSLPYISIKPVINLSGEKTGGISHRDVAFNPGADSNPPQIAVIDECGNWTVWDIMETRSDGHRKLYPLRRFCGQFINGLMENSVLFGSGQGDSYRLCWVRSKKGLSRWLRDLDSPLGNPHSETGQGSPDDVSSRCESLLLSDRTTVKLFCLTTGRFLRALTMARHNKADRILDVHRSPFDASQVFVLTTSTVFWLDLSAVKESRDPVLTGVKAEDATANRPIVLLSCPHLRDQGDSTLKIAVLSGSNLGRNGLCLTWIYSARDGLTTLLWLEGPKTGCPARVQYHLFRLGSIVNPVPQQIELLPVSLYYNSEVRGGGQGLRYSQDGARFFQVVFLGPKLSLSSALLAVKRRTGVDIESTSYCYRPTSRSHRRAKAISYLASSFVVSDTFDERSAVPPDQTIPGSPLPGTTTVEEEAQIATADFSRVLDVVSQRVAHSVQRVELPSNHASGYGPLDLLENHLQTTHTADRQISLHTLLELAGDFTADFETQIMGNNCTAQLENLKNEFEDLQVAELSRGGRIMSGASLLRALEVMWSESLPEGVLDEHALQRRQSLLSHITTLLCLSQTGVTISSVPLPPRESQGSQLTSSDAMELSPSPPGRLPTPIDTASIANSSVGSDPLEPGTPKESPGDQEDEAITRLRRYAVSIKSVPPRKEGQLRLLSHWPKSPGSDPSGYVWSADNARNALLDEALEKRRKDEARRRRKAAKLGLQRSEDDMAGPSTQPLPHIPHSSQSQAPSAFESQSSLAPVQTMSQPLGGSHGGRPKKQKAKKVGGFK